jgi:2-polyprenyl-6-methoxyphenol hydroxylase-like FAD-dependent oxidoreductase
VAQIVIIGGGVVGMGLGMLLARDEHEVTILERDAEPPPGDPDAAWDSWERRGVNQFRLPHLFLPCYREILERELPEVVKAIEGDGALRFNPLGDAPDSMSGGPRPGDERFDMLTGRRAVVERSVASVAEETPHLDVRRGTAVEGLVGGASVLEGVPHVTGVRTSQGDEILADVVIDCSGRRSALPDWLEALGARRPLDEIDDSGFIYLGRHFRSRDGQMPVALGPPLQAYGSISVLTLPADNDVWSVTLVARSGDRALLGLRDQERWERAVRALPTVAHWLDGDPLEDRIMTISKIEDRHRDLRPDGSPVATGVLAAADAWGCTNPSVGRGASIGMLHARALRDTLRQTEAEHPAELSEAFADATASTVEPWYRATLSFDRHRLAEMAAIAEGVTYETDDPAYEMGGALALAGSHDPECFRGFLDIVSVLELPEAVLSRPGVFEKVIEHGAGWHNEPAFGPTRDELVAIANG